MKNVKTEKPSQKTGFKSNRIFSIFIAANIVASIGILGVTVGGSWDVTNHLLNKPETFFSPPHAFMYSGVAVSLIGCTISFFSWRKLSDEKRNQYRFPLKVLLLGIGILVSAGPIDFAWHSNFGLDGLLSPPHLILIAGMILTSVGAMLSISRFVNAKSGQGKTKTYPFLISLAMLPVWLGATGLFYSLSLPFSETEYFDFNPDPTFAIIFASLGYPFLIAFSLLLASNLANNRFGVLTTVGVMFLIVNGLTSIVTNESIQYTIPFYFLNIIPITISDLIVSQLRKSQMAHYVTGAVLGMVFFMVFYPLPTYTYNDILLHQMVWPSIISTIYFEMIKIAFPLVVGPSIMMGLIGAFFAKKIKQKILKEEIVR